MDNIWTSVMINKYIEPLSLEDQIRAPDKYHAGGSIFWKAVIKSFDVIGGGLAWSVGNGRKIHIREDPWAGCLQKHILMEDTIQAIITYTNQQLQYKWSTGDNLGSEPRIWAWMHIPPGIWRSILDRSPEIIFSLFEIV